MKIIYLLPPSEGKNTWWQLEKEKLSFVFEKPLTIASQATEKDLKCTGKRYEEGITLNTQIADSEVLPAIERYTGVMYHAIDYISMNQTEQRYFEENFLILSGMYGLVKPTDTIGNYKLPIETKWLYWFWGDKITQALNNLEADIIMNLLPGSYAKMIDWHHISAKVIYVNFLHNKNGELKKITHGVKKVKGEYIRNICSEQGKSFQVDSIWQRDMSLDILV